MVDRYLGFGCALGAASLLAGAALAQAPSAYRSPGVAPGRPITPGMPGSLPGVGVPGGGFGTGSMALRDALFGQRLSESRRRPTPPVARFLTETGESFTLDRTSPRPLLRFDGSGEVWVLEEQAAPRGDKIYKNDLGQQVLRATRLGGLTVFTNSQPEGAAAALLGGAQPLRLPTISPQQLIAVLAQASERISRAARRSIPIEFKADEASAPLVADAAGRAADAVVRMARGKNSRKVVDRISKIVIGEGRKPEATMNGDGVVNISVTPDMGVAGRPSSERIVLASSGGK